MAHVCVTGLTHIKGVVDSVIILFGLQSSRQTSPESVFHHRWLSELYEL